MDRKIELLKKLRDINQEYLKSNNARKERLFDASRFVVDELSRLVGEDDESRRVAVAWGDTLLCFGDEFTLYEYGLTVDQAINALDNISRL